MSEQPWCRQSSHRVASMQNKLKIFSKLYEVLYTIYSTFIWEQHKVVGLHSFHVFCFISIDFFFLLFLFSFISGWSLSGTFGINLFYI